MSVQFHAHPLELIKIGLALSKEFDLFFIYADIKTKELFFVNSEKEIDDVGFCGESGYLMVLLEKELTVEIDCFSKLHAIQKKGIFIEVGVLNEEGLKESIISFSKEDIQYAKVDPKKVIARFKKFTMTGAIAFNIKTGTSGISKTHRYTKAAKNLYDSGVKIIPFGGGKTVFFKLP